MFAVIFEVQPRAEQWETYLGIAQGLRPALEQIDGFVDNVRYRSLTRPGWLLSLSGWRDEAAALALEAAAAVPDDARLRRVRVVRDYGMFDRREAPQFYPEVTRGS